MHRQKRTSFSDTKQNVRVSVGRTRSFTNDTLVCTLSLTAVGCLCPSLPVSIEVCSWNMPKLFGILPEFLFARCTHIHGSWGFFFLFRPLVFFVLISLLNPSSHSIPSSFSTKPLLLPVRSFLLLFSRFVLILSRFRPPVFPPPSSFLRFFIFVCFFWVLNNTSQQPYCAAVLTDM